MVAVPDVDVVSDAVVVVVGYRLLLRTSDNAVAVDVGRFGCSFVG